MECPGCVKAFYELSTWRVFVVTRAQVEMHAILLEYGLPYHFPEDVEAEAETIPKDLDPKEIQRRRDRRDETTFTIDPEDAKDFVESGLMKSEKRYLRDVY